MSQKITTPFAGVAGEVDDDEAAVLKRMGLLTDGSGPEDAATAPAPVEVHTRFGVTVTVPPEEAATLARQGLTAEPDDPARPRKRPTESEPTTSASPAPEENA